MIVQYKDVEPYLHLIDWTGDNTCIGGNSDITLFSHFNGCEQCPFKFKTDGCAIDRETHNLDELTNLVKRLHPELFI